MNLGQTQRTQAERTRLFQRIHTLEHCHLDSWRLCSPCDMEALRNECRALLEALRAWPEAAIYRGAVYAILHGSEAFDVDDPEFNPYLNDDAFELMAAYYYLCINIGLPPCCYVGMTSQSLTTLIDRDVAHRERTGRELDPDEFSELIAEMGGPRL